MTQKLITLGCSLTHQIGWADYIARNLKIPLVNLAVSSGSNRLQQKRIQSYIFENNIGPDDIIIWQLTGSGRYHFRDLLTPNSLRDAKIKNSAMQYMPIDTSSVNCFDNEPRLDFLSHAVKPNNYVLSRSAELDRLEDLLFYIISLSKFTPNVLVIVGWSTVFPAGCLQIFKEKLSKFSISYIDETIVDYCKEQNLTFNGEDKTHPTAESHHIYAEKIILPRLVKLINTNGIK